MVHSNAINANNKIQLKKIPINRNILKANTRTIKILYE